MIELQGQARLEVISGAALGRGVSRRAAVRRNGHALVTLWQRSGRQTRCLAGDHARAARIEARSGRVQPGDRRVELAASDFLLLDIEVKERKHSTDVAVKLRWSRRIDAAAR